MPRRQKGGFSHGVSNKFESYEIGKGMRPAHQIHKGCGLRTQLGGSKGLVGAAVKGSFGHRPIFKSPSYGFTKDSVMFKGAPANMASVELGGCPTAGGAKRRKRRKSLSKKRRKRRKTKKRRKRKTRNKRKKSRSRNKRRKNTKRRIKRKLIGCGQKGGQKLDSTWSPNLAFRGNIDYKMGNLMGLPTLERSTYSNCHDAYNHFKR